MKFAFRVVAAFATFGCLHLVLRADEALRAPPATSASYEVVDLMPAFWSFWDEAQHEQPGVRAELFRRRVLQSQEASPFYALFPAPVNDGMAGRFLAQVPQRAGVMRAVSEKFPGAVTTAWDGFIRRFPDFDQKITICSIASAYASGV